MTQINKLNHTLVDPQFVQIGRKEFANIIGRSETELDRLRKTDKRCPKGNKGNGKLGRVKWMLADVYAYSKILFEEGELN